MKSKSRLFIHSLFILAALLLVSATQLSSPVKAQSSAIEWSAPFNLSNTPESSSRPAIVSDRFGNVHVFWSEEVGGKSIYGIPKALIHDGNTIMYTRWDGKTWGPTQLAVPPEAPIEERLLSDAFYARQRSWARDLSVLWQGLRLLLSAEAWRRPS